MRSRRGIARQARNALRVRHADLWERLSRYPTDEEVIRAIRSVPTHYTGVTFLQAPSGAGNSGTGNLTATYASSCTSGSLLVAAVAIFSSSATVSVSDGTNGSWTQAGSYATNGSNRVGLFYFPNNAGTTALTVTVNKGGTSLFAGLCIAEYSGCATSNPVDGTSTNTGTGTAVTTGSVAVNAAGELVVAAACQGSHNDSMTAGTGFTLRASQTDGANFMGCYLEDDGGPQNSGASSATDAGMTLSQSESWASIGVSFKTAGGGVVTAPPMLPLLGVG